MTAPRPTRLMAETPSMSWAEHVDSSRRSKLAVAAVVVGVLVFAAGFILGMAVSA